MAHVDYTGCDVLCQVRAYAASPDVLLTIPGSVNSDGDIVLDEPDTGDWAGMRGAWDVQVTWPGGDVETVLAGSFGPRQDVSR